MYSNESPSSSCCSAFSVQETRMRTIDNACIKLRFVCDLTNVFGALVAYERINKFLLFVGAGSKHFDPFVRQGLWRSGNQIIQYQQKVLSPETFYTYRGSVWPTQKMFCGKGRNTTPSSLLVDPSVVLFCFLPSIIKKSVGSLSCINMDAANKLLMRPVCVFPSSTSPIKGPWTFHKQHNNWSVSINKMKMRGATLTDFRVKDFGYSFREHINCRFLSFLCFESGCFLAFFALG